MNELNSLPGYVYCLEDRRSLKDAFSRFPVAQTEINQVTIEDSKELPNIDDVKMALEDIDKQLEKNLGAAKQKAALILDNHTRQLSKVIEKSAPESKVEMPKLPSANLEIAVDNLTDTAQNLEDVVTASSEEN